MPFDECIILGGNGRLGSALALQTRRASTRVLPRGQYLQWVDPDHARRYLRACPGRVVIHVAAGIINPTADLAELEQVNLRLPLSIAAALEGSEHRLVTYGTVMEQILPVSHMNPYIAGKLELSQQLASMGLSRRLDYLHLRLHTLYGGGKPAPFMFAGQMLAALLSGTRFRMTDGSQFREYHHIDDEAAAIETICETWPSGSGDISHGDPIRLRDLARSVFEGFAALDLLEIGAIPALDSDHYALTPRSSAKLAGTEFRDTRSGIIAWFNSLGCGVPTRRNAD